MAASYKKAIKVSSPRAKPSGMSKFAHTSPPKLSPLKTRIYTKAAANQDPSMFGASGFGNTGLLETPSIIGMSQKPK